MNRYLLIFLFFGLLLASHENIGISPEARALGESIVGKGYGISGLYSNPAGLLDGEKIQFYASYEKPYGSSGLGEINLISVGIKYSNFAISLNEYYTEIEGDYSGAYSEGLYTISYATIFGPMSFGTNLNLYKFQEPRFGTDFTAGLDLGVMSRISDFVGAGVFYRNITRSRIRGEYLPYYLDAGVHVSVQGLSKSFITFRMSPNSLVTLMFGEEVDLAKGLLTLRGGLNYGEDLKKASFGIGVNPLNNLKINYSFSTNFELSPSHSLGIVFRR